MERELAEYFFMEASRLFDFLVQEYSFSQPRLEINDRIDFAYVLFIGERLCVECILDVREEDIDCKVAEVVGGRKTSHYEFDDGGRLVRDDLHSILRRKRVRCQFTNRRGLSLRQSIPVTLADFAGMLKRNAEIVLSGDPFN